MAKPKAPLFSLGASGQLGKVLVYGNWKGIDVAREYVIPANPNTALQSTQRGRLTSAVTDWHTTGADALEGADKTAWNRFAGTLKPMSGFNAFTQAFIDELVAGGTPPGHFFDLNVTATLAAAFACDVEGSGLAVEVVSLNLGNTKTFFPVVQTQAAVAGVATFAAFDTTFAAGENVFFFFDVGVAGTDFMRSGLYTALLT